ncbi:MAG: trans-acting enoyl reductase family protein, partial [Saprospiraceae bacterium]
MAKRKYDVVIFGATGFTGRLVAEYLLEQYSVGGDLKWAMAGRSAEKLQKIQNEIGAEDVDTIIADSKDRASLDAMTAQTKVICTTVGPYAMYGSDLVASCIENGTHYCDLTGEVQWIRRMIDQHHDAAVAQKVKIVNSCGFDSIPSDMGVFYLQKEAKERFGEPCQKIKFRLKAAKGGFSGGTVASLNYVLEEAAQDKSIFDILENPYSLAPAGERQGVAQDDAMVAGFDEDLQAHTAPFVMAPINTKVVRRSNALLGYPYGKDFQYDEKMLSGKGISGKLTANVIAGGMGLVMGAKPGSLFKKVIDRFTPDPGEGPSKKERENGFFSIILIGKTKDGRIIRGRVKGKRDPGYGCTSRMLAESAVSLAKDKLL